MSDFAHANDRLKGDHAAGCKRMAITITVVCASLRQSENLSLARVTLHALNELDELQ